MVANPNGVVPRLATWSVQFATIGPRATAPRASLVILGLLLGLNCCASGPYDPPVQGDHTSERYKADLEKCRTSSTESVRLKNADTLGTWIMSPYTGPSAVRAEIRKCLVSKGYVLTKAED